MSALDVILGLAEVVFLPLSLVWLARACIRPTSRRVRHATLAALLLAVTIAQPFGMVAHEKAAPALTVPPGSGAETVHLGRVLSVPLLPFRLYAKPRLLALENMPTEELKARSWFWLPILSNGTKIADICGNAFEPCWRPEWKDSRSAILRNRPATRNLTVMRDGSRYWVVIENVSVSGRQFRPRFSWELRPGITSPAGLVYWGLAGALIASARRRLRHRKPTLPSI